MRLYQEAEKSYDKAIAIKPDKYEAWINRGIALTQLQQIQTSFSILRQSDRDSTEQTSSILQQSLHLCFAK